jgi:hypothetical protein
MRRADGPERARRRVERRSCPGQLELGPGSEPDRRLRLRDRPRRSQHRSDNRPDVYGPDRCAWNDLFLFRPRIRRRRRHWRPFGCRKRHAARVAATTAACDLKIAERRWSATAVQALVRYWCAKAENDEHSREGLVAEPEQPRAAYRGTGAPVTGEGLVATWRKCDTSPARVGSRAPLRDPRAHVTKEDAEAAAWRSRHGPVDVALPLFCDDRRKLRPGLLKVGRSRFDRPSSPSRARGSTT